MSQNKLYDILLFAIVTPLAYIQFTFFSAITIVPFILEKPVRITGTIIEKQDKHISVFPWSSNRLWDETDIAYLDKPAKLILPDNSHNLKIGQKIIAEGEIQQQGTLKIRKLYPSYLQPLGLDWKSIFLAASVALGISVMIAWSIVIFNFRKLFKH